MYKITKKLADKLRNKAFHKDCCFNPIQDINGEWFISKEEIKQNTNRRYKGDLETLVKATFVAPLPPDDFTIAPPKKTIKSL